MLFLTYDCFALKVASSSRALAMSDSNHSTILPALLLLVLKVCSDSHRVFNSKSANDSDTECISIHSLTICLLGGTIYSGLLMLFICVVFCWLVLRPLCVIWTRDLLNGFFKVFFPPGSVLSLFLFLSSLNSLCVLFHFPLLCLYTFSLPSSVSVSISVSVSVSLYSPGWSWAHNPLA